MGFDIAKIISDLPCRHYDIEPVSDAYTGGYYDYCCNKCGRYFDYIEARALHNRMIKEFESFSQLAKARELVKANG